MVGFPASFLTVVPSFRPACSVIRPSASLFSSSSDFARSLLPQPVTHSFTRARSHTDKQHLDTTPNSLSNGPDAPVDGLPSVLASVPLALHL